MRGLGAMRALELVKDSKTREPAPEHTRQVAQYCYEHGLITITAGTHGNVIRILVPLVVSPEEMDEGLGVLEDALASVSKDRSVFAGASIQ
jgi:4-aminobutyrate aminotransferase/(S)-3-amino-2-methylpropionate transaminase